MKKSIHFLSLIAWCFLFTPNTTYAVQEKSGGAKKTDTSQEQKTQSQKQNQETPAQNNQDQNQDNQNQNTSSNCTICLGELEGNNVIPLSCDDRHKFHIECIRQWAQENRPGNNLCPICKGVYNEFEQLRQQETNTSTQLTDDQSMSQNSREMNEFVRKIKRNALVYGLVCLSIPALIEGLSLAGRISPTPSVRALGGILGLGGLCFLYMYWKWKNAFDH